MGIGLHSSQHRLYGLPFRLGIVLVVGYIVSRLAFLTRLPVFVDESTDIQWAQETIHGQLMAGAYDSKWLPVKIMALFTLLPFDVLFCVRLAAVIMGLATLVACILIYGELFSWPESLLAGLVYVVLPFALFYDRLALAEIYLSAFGAWCIFLSIVLIKRKGPIPVLSLCVVTCAAILSKLTGAVFLAMPLIVCVFLVANGSRHAYLRGTAPAFISGLGLLLFLIWRGYGTQQVSANAGIPQLTLFLQNLRLSYLWLTTLLTPILAFVGASAVLVWAWFGVTRQARPEAFLVALILVTFIPYALVSVIWFPRYLLSMVVPISLLLARTIEISARKISESAPGPMRSRTTALAILASVLLLVPSSLNWSIITSPETAPLPSAETEQYVRGWASGYGLPELAEFLRSQSQASEVNIVRFNFWAPPFQGLDVYLNATGAMHIYTLDPFDLETPTRIVYLAQVRRTLFVSNPEGEQLQGVVTQKYLANATRVWHYARPGLESSLEVWELSGSNQQSQ